MCPKRNVSSFPIFVPLVNKFENWSKRIVLDFHEVGTYFWPLQYICNMTYDVSEMLSYKQNMTVKPPSLPRGLGSRLWPKYTFYEPEEVANKTVAVQLADAAKARQAGERQMYKMMKQPCYRQLRRECDSVESQRSRTPYCKVCSEVVTEVRHWMQDVHHRHNSSLQFRMNAKLNEKGEYECPTCDVPRHLYLTGERIALLVTSSTLANWTVNGRRLGLYPGTPIHLDAVEIPGARVMELLHGLLAEYQGHWINLDVTLMGGLNDLLKGGSAAKLMKDLHTFKITVEGLKQGNTCGVVTLPYPPKLSCLPKDSKEMWPPGFVDRTVDIWTVNEYIGILNDSGPNRSTTRIVPRPQTFGLKASTSMVDRRMGKMVKHELKGWREWRVKDKLHLADKERVKIGKMLVRYYLHIYHIEDTPFLTRKEAEDAYKEECKVESEASKLIVAGKDSRRVLNQRKERELVEEEVLRQWGKQEEEEWRKRAVTGAGGIKGGSGSPNNSSQCSGGGAGGVKRGRSEGIAGGARCASVSIDAGAGDGAGDGANGANGARGAAVEQGGRGGGPAGVNDGDSDSDGGPGDGTPILAVTVNFDKNGETISKVVKTKYVKTCYQGNESGCLGCCSCLR